MKLDKLVIILMLALCVGAAAFYFSGQQTEKVEDQEGGVIFLPGLMTKINQVAQIVVTEKEAATHLLLKDNRWVVREQADYDAEFAKVKKLLLGLAELKTVESKTSKPENYGRLGVQNPDQAGDVQSRQIQLLDKADNVMYTLIVGKNKPARAPGANDAIYVRQKDTLQSWLVSGKIDLPASQNDWLNKKIIDLSSTRIRSVEIKQPDDSRLLISKKDQADKNYAVANLPAKAELKSESVANSIASVLQNLSFEAVLARGNFQADEKQISTTTFTTFDGLTVMAKLLEKESRFYLWFDTKTDSKDEKIIKESAELNAKFALWVYEIPSFKASSFQKKLADLLKVEG